LHRSTLAGLMLASLAALPSSAAARPDALSERVVRVRAIAADGTSSHGTGVALDAERVATACHVTRRATTIHVERHGLALRAVAQAGSELHDLCVLRVATGERTEIRARPSGELHVGDPVTAVGFQDSASQAAVRHGVVVALHRYDGGHVVQTDAAFDFGASGGALFDRDGHLVGILGFKARTGESLRFALPADWLAATSTVAASFAPITDVPRTSAFWERPQGDRPDFLGVALREANARR
jgi:S1-C subfamily serine protease